MLEVVQVAQGAGNQVNCLRAERLSHLLAVLLGHDQVKGVKHLNDGDVADSPSKLELETVLVNVKCQTNT